MSSFSVRVVLHNSNDYANVHADMESVGFSRTITADSGVVYHLPNGEYIVQDVDWTIHQIHSEVLAVVQQHSAAVSIFVTQWADAGVRFSGLTPVRPQLRALAWR